MKAPIIDPVATARLLLAKPGREPYEIAARLGRPYSVSEDEARCPVEILGFESQYPDICGSDTQQATALAITLVRLRLEDALDKGCILTRPGDTEPLAREDLRSVFSEVQAALVAG